MDTEELNIEIVKLEKRWKRVGRCPGTEVVVDQYRHNLDREKLNVLNGDIILSPLTAKHGKRVGCCPGIEIVVDQFGHSMNTEKN